MGMGSLNIRISVWRVMKPVYELTVDRPEPRHRQATTSTLPALVTPRYTYSTINRLL